MKTLFSLFFAVLLIVAILRMCIAASGADWLFYRIIDKIINRINKKEK